MIAIRELFVLGVLWSGVAAFGLGPAADDPLETGRTLTDLFYKGEVEKLWERFDDPMKTALTSLEGVRAFRRQVSDQLGSEEAILGERVVKSPSGHIYVRHARFEKYDKPIEVFWSFDDKGAIDGFYIRPAQREAETPHLEYKTKTPLRLPFDGEWYVFWGGRSVAENYHAFTLDQRFAYDILIMKDGRSHTGDGTKNEQYHCFGRPIVAPAGGKIVEAVDGIEDNVPGKMNPNQAVGNHVVIDHGNGEFSFLAHFQKGSLKVRKGQEVKPGDLLGLCGNSGNSSEPHLHYHMQTSPEYRKGEGLPTQFLDYVADGKKVDRGEPVKGQTIRAVAP